MKNNLAFSLVELLVTITIVGILSAMSLALFDEYRSRAQDTHAISVAHDLVTAYQNLMIDYETPYDIYQSTGIISVDKRKVHGWSNSTHKDTILPGISINDDGLVLIVRTGNVNNTFSFIVSHCSARHKIVGSYLRGWYWYDRHAPPQSMASTPVENGGSFLYSYYCP